MSRNGRRVVAMAGAWLVASAAAWAQEPAISSADRVEAVQQRSWKKAGSLELAPFAGYGLNDPFLLRGGVGLRAVWWPRSLVGLTVEASGWTQAPSEAARVAQRELKARLRETGSGWAVLGGGEVALVDGKVAFGSALVPFELVVRALLGAESSTEELRSGAVLALGAAVGARFFLWSGVGLETSLVWRSASLEREIDGRVVSGRDTVVSFEVGVPLRFGGG